MMRIVSVSSELSPSNRESTDQDRKPYRKIKVSSSTKCTLPQTEVVRGVRRFINEKTQSNIIKGNCIVEVTWDGKDLSTLDFESIQQLTDEEVRILRKDNALDRESSTESPELFSISCANEKIAVSTNRLPSSMTPRQIAVPASQIRPAAPAVPNGIKYQRSNHFQQTALPLKLSSPLSLKIIRLGGSSPNSIATVRPGPRSSALRNTLTTKPTIWRPISTATPVLQAPTRPSFTQIVPPLGRPPIRLSSVVTAMRIPPSAPVPTGLHVARVTYDSTNRAKYQSSRQAYCANKIQSSPTYRSSLSNVAETAACPETIIIRDPAPRPVPNGFSRQPPVPTGTIQPAQSAIRPRNPLNVRAKDGIQPARPGQLIRRTTGEIVKVLPDGSLERVLDVSGVVQPPHIPKPTIISSREKPISLDSDSDDEPPPVKHDPAKAAREVHLRGVKPAASKLPKVQQRNFPVSNKKAPLRKQRTSKVRSGQPKSTAHVRNEITLDSSDDEEDVTYDGSFHQVLFNEGEPFTDEQLNEIDKKAEAVFLRYGPKRGSYKFIRPASALDFMDCVIVAEDGEVRLDPDLYQAYLEILAKEFMSVCIPEDKAPAQNFARRSESPTEWMSSRSTDSASDSGTEEEKPRRVKSRSNSNSSGVIYRPGNILKTVNIDLVGKPSRAVFSPVMRPCMVVLDRMVPLDDCTVIIKKDTVNDLFVVEEKNLFFNQRTETVNADLRRAMALKLMKKQPVRLSPALGLKRKKNNDDRPKKKVDDQCVDASSDEPKLDDKQIVKFKKKRVEKEA